ncbi:hypothetical protein JK361_33355 [Streptomyces sp. 5-8]|uniref:Uncharacterized protein n=1 Tax=Streptomyces musisoli TaxID=2802280 RepID=A0ABS1PAM6_9ACTN|nr:hypothetical protein [Streptomyces musisoli]MBL1109413.1 hypothetical protein [Streptomyces musisoli]
MSYPRTRGDDPCKVIRLGTRNFRVVTADLRRVLHAGEPADSSTPAT